MNSRVKFSLFTDVYTKVGFLYWLNLFLVKWNVCGFVGITVLLVRKQAASLSCELFSYEFFLIQRTWKIVYQDTVLKFKDNLWSIDTFSFYFRRCFDNALAFLFSFNFIILKVIQAYRKCNQTGTHKVTFRKINT